MSVRTESLDSIFGVTTPTTLDVVPTSAETLPARAESTELAKPEPPAEDVKEHEDDFQLSRKNLKDLLINVDEASTHALDAVRETMDPKSIEAYAKLVNAQVIANKQLMDMHVTKKQVRENAKPTAPLPGDPAAGGQFNQQNIIFTGGSKELLDLINKDRS